MVLSCVSGGAVRTLADTVCLRRQVLTVCYGFYSGTSICPGKTVPPTHEIIHQAIALTRDLPAVVVQVALSGVEEEVEVEEVSEPCDILAHV